VSYPGQARFTGLGQEGLVSPALVSELFPEAAGMLERFKQKGCTKVEHIQLAIFFFLVGLEFEFRALHCKAGATLLEPHFRYIFLWFFWRWGS
jgi:hypothetical protein